MMSGKKKGKSREDNSKERKIMQLFAAFIMCAIFIYGVFFAEKAGPMVLSFLFAAFCWCLFSAARGSRFIRAALYLCMIMYLILLFELTLFNYYYRSEMTSIFYVPKEERISFIKQYVNLKPFYMIKLFWTGYQNGSVTLKTMLRNIFGNVAAFMPFGFFIGVLRPDTKNKRFLVILVLLVTLIETLQLIMMAGTFDIDDFLLNIPPAYVMFLIMKTRAGRSLADRLFYSGAAGKTKDGSQ